MALRYFLRGLLCLLILFPIRGYSLPLEEGWQALREGRSAEALEVFSAAIENDPGSTLSAYWGIAAAYEQLGRLNQALDALNRAQLFLRSDSDRNNTDLRMGSVLRALGKHDLALGKLQPLLSQQGLSAQKRIALYSTLGAVEADLKQYDNAVDHFNKASQLASVSDDLLQVARIHVNLARAEFDRKNIRDVESRLHDIELLLAALPDTLARTQLYIALGELYRDNINALAFPIAWREKALRAFDTAISSASNSHTLGYALGFKAALYEDEARLGEALKLTRQALYHAQLVNADEQIYRWDWQLGRILRARSQAIEAEAAYARAATVLRQSKGDLPLGAGNTFRQLVEPVYIQYADVMLQRIRTMPEGSAKQQSLLSVRDLLEALKEAEVEDYFSDECVVGNSQDQSGEVLPGDTAILYPVFLDERIELVVEVGGMLAQFTTPVGRNQATQEIRRLRLNLERAMAGDNYLKHAQQLHNWLLAPMSEFLRMHSVNTLVIVPEGALRTIPLAALHDGNQFLIEKYAIATTPAIKLTQQLKTVDIENLFIGGLSEGVQDFPSLPMVDMEIEAISAMYPSRSARNADFSLGLVESELQHGNFSVAHFATHGEFNRDYRKSFLLTYDDRFTLSSMQNALERREGSPLDLLVLSACQTAAGDDRAALGLAGVAVQSGARSALASLWSISDSATAELISEFYTQLKNAQQTKAQSLRTAQRKLLSKSEFQHPSYWAPYLLIGNWL